MSRQGRLRLRRRRTGGIVASVHPERFVASAQPTRAEHHVVDVVRTGPTLGNDAGTLFVDLHLPVLVQQRGDHRRPDVVGRVEAALVHRLGVHPGVVDQQQETTGATADSSARSAAASGVRNSAGYCAETRSNDPGGSEASASPACTQWTVTPASRACPAARSSATPETSRAVTVQPRAREPDGVRALTTADVEHPSRGQVGHFDHERTVRPATPQPLATLGVARVPLRPDRRVTDIAVNSGLLAECGRTHREVIGHGTIVAQQSSA